MKIAVISANIGNFDVKQNHVPQSIPVDYFVYNEPLRSKAMTPRLQAKIPKCFAWQLYPNYDYYLWLDGNISLNQKNTVEHLLKQIGKNDFLVFKHPNHIDIRQETRYTRKGIKQKAKYLFDRYAGEQVEELYNEIKDYFTDDKLFIGGIFLYKNKPLIQYSLKEWFHYMCRFALQDQISLPFILSWLNVKVLPDVYDESPLFKIIRHK